jgi:hypothetical protein
MNIAGITSTHTQQNKSFTQQDKSCWTEENKSRLSTHCLELAARSPRNCCLGLLYFEATAGLPALLDRSLSRGCIGGLRLRCNLSDIYQNSLYALMQVFRGVGYKQDHTMSICKSFLALEGR